MQMELKKEIEHAEIDESQNGTLKIDIQAAPSQRSRGQRMSQMQAQNISIDDLLTETDPNKDFSALFKK